MTMDARRLRDRVFLAVDTETTGRPTSAGGLIEIAAVRFLGSGEVLDTFSQLVRPRHSVSPFATKVHGLRTADLADQPRIEQVMPRFGAFLEEGAPIVLAHNAGFDLSYLSVAFQASGMEQPANSVYCTLDIARKLMPEAPGFRLGVLGESLGLPQGVLHRALADCVLLKDIFVHWVNVFPAFNTVEELEAGFRKWAFGIRKRKVRSRRRRGNRPGDDVVDSASESPDDDGSHEDVVDTADV
ncbi:MAG: 3'-5' exonuclease [Candidatus Sericytochromatia bacterium]|nr:3'-5' exonuclease [Candidatus Sericytochromatia bacterium]